MTYAWTARSLTGNRIGILTSDSRVYVKAARFHVDRVSGSS